MAEQLDIEDDWMQNKLKRMRENTVVDLLQSKSKRSYAQFAIFSTENDP
jgi:hypothetical protein